MMYQSTALVRTCQRNQEVGQGLLLMVMAMTMIATGVGLYALQQAQHTQRESIEFKRSSNVMAALNGVAQYLQQIYYNEANCDPYLLNQRLNQLSNRTYQSRLRTQSLALDSGSSPTFNSGIGAMSPQPPSPASLQPPLGTNASGANPAPYTAGYEGFGAQDVSITYWVVPYGTMGERGATRYEQTVTLINTCSPNAPANYALASPRPAFNTITDPAGFAAAVLAEVPNTQTANVRCGTRARGSIDSNDAAITLGDREVFMNYVRSGDTAGVTDDDCADMNSDGIFNEVDLNILDKTMKGYLYFNAPANQSF